MEEPLKYKKYESTALENQLSGYLILPSVTWSDPPDTCVNLLDLVLTIAQYRCFN